MTGILNRRNFLQQTTTAALAAAVPLSGQTAAFAQPQRAARPLKKAVKIGMVRVDLPLPEKFKLLKELGFDGVELDSPNDLDPQEVLEARDRSGLTIHGVVDAVHWRLTLSDPDPQVRAQGVEALRTALRDAKTYGGTSVLLVPAVVSKEVSYADAYKRSQAEVRKVLPLAEQLGIRILFENVWNNFLLSPLEFARYIDEFDTEIVGAYFDVGNVVRFGWPEHWIDVLGRRIGKIDIKEYSRKLQNTKGPYAGFDVELGEGDCDWPAVLRSLEQVGYRGWATAEVRGGDADRLRDISQRMDRIFGYRR